MSKYLNIKERHQWYEISKLDILKFFEREIERFQNIIGFSKEQASNMKLDVSEMIKEGSVNENTVADEKFIRDLLDIQTQ